MTAAPHPIARFRAPTAIRKGQALKNLLDGELVALIGDSFAGAWSGFPRERFRRAADRDLADLELGDRARQIARALASVLPDRPSEAITVLVRSLGPPLQRTDAIGLRPFFYLPHSHLLAVLAPQAFDVGLEACHALTRRFTAEFAIRPLLIADAARVHERLRQWCHDEDAHVRRLVSEGTRPRLPWASRLPAAIADPTPNLDLLERLHRDGDRYVQRSVANHLGDIAKDHLDLALTTCAVWLRECDGLADPDRRNLCWVIRHALRHPAKRGVARALALRSAAGQR